MDIGSISSMYLNNIKDSSSSVKTGDMTGKLKNGLEGKSDEELMDACKEFEAYFIEQIFKNMKSAMVPSSESTDGATSMLKDYYEDELMSQYASQAAGQSSNGLAQMLYEQMKRNQGTTDITKIDDVATANASAAAAAADDEQE